MLSLMIALLAFQDRPEVTESIRVQRTIIEVRVVDRSGAPVPGLEAEDFLLTRRGEPVEIISCQWVDAVFEGAVTEPREGELFEEETEPDPYADEVFWEEDPFQDVEGRIIVYFFQKAGSADLGKHLVRMLRYARDNLENLHENDYVAVFSFDTSLRMNLDLSRDREAASRAFDDAVTRDEGLPFGIGDHPSIGAFIPRLEADQVNHTAPALITIASALARLPGHKTMIFLGQGFTNATGEVGNFGPAIDALRIADTPVFVLDANNADRHSRETMLLELADKTGGFYYRMYKAPQNAFPRIERAIAGYYELIYDTAITPGDPELRISVGKPHFEILVADPILPIYR